jgi:alpha-tubulin suppressor-like RCC1 family protein
MDTSVDLRKRVVFVALAVLVIAVVLVPSQAQGVPGGTVDAWGCNPFSDFGQCTEPSGLSDVVAVAGGYAHSIALRGDGTVVAWGCGSPYGEYNQCNVPVGLSGVTAIAAGTVHNLALKSDGTVVAWGCDGGPEFYGCNVPSGLTDVTAIDAGTTTASR